MRLLKYFVLSVFSLCLLFCAFDLPTVSEPAVTAQQLPPINYDIVYVRMPRRGDNTNLVWPDALTPLLLERGQDLMLLHPNGAEEVLFSAGVNGAVMDPLVSFDAKSVVFSFFPNVRNQN